MDSKPGLEHIFAPALPPVPAPARKRKGLRYRLSRRAGGLRLLHEKGRAHFAAIGRRGGLAAAGQPRSGPAAMERVESRIPVAAFAELQRLSMSTGQSHSALVRQWILQGIEGARE